MTLTTWDVGWTRLIWHKAPDHTRAWMNGWVGMCGYLMIGTSEDGRVYR